jgi:hypothetical protein
MTTNMIRALVLFLASQSFVLASSLVFFAMVGEVNRKVPEEQRISYLFWHFNKYRALLRQYRRLYPSGRLALYSFVLIGIGICLFLASAWQFGFFH